MWLPSGPKRSSPPLLTLEEAQCAVWALSSQCEGKAFAVPRCVEDRCWPVSGEAQQARCVAVNARSPSLATLHLFHRPRAHPHPVLAQVQPAS